MARPDVNIALSNNRLGRLPQDADGTMGLIASGVAIPGQIVLGEVYGPFRSIKELEAKGITQAWGIANKSLAWHHCNEFFDEAQTATPLYLMLVAATVTMAEMGDPLQPYAKKMIEGTSGAVRMVGLSRVPDVAYEPVYVGEMDPDVVAALAKLKELQAEQFALHRPIRFLVEGRAWGGDASATTDLRNPTTGPRCNMAGVVLGQSKEVADADAAFGGYAFVGRVLGRFARIQVQRSIGRVKDGPIGTVNANMSDGTAMGQLTNIEVNVLHDKGYIFALSYPDQPGWYFNGGHAACPIDDDYSDLKDGRTIDKAARITYDTYVVEILDDVEVDTATGLLPLAVCKFYEGIVEAAIGTRMAGNISGVGAYVNPAQNIVQTGVLNVQVDVVKRGTIEHFSVELGFATNIAQ